MAVPAPDLAALRLLGDRIRPLSAAAERLVPVPAALASLLPLGGLQRGSLVASTGAAATSVGLALAGSATQAGSWCAAVGLDHVGLLAAAELGVALDRLLLVAVDDPARWPATVAALLDAVDVVLVRPPGRVAPTLHRRLVARARERGAVLLQVGGGAGAWAEQPDLSVRTARARWEGAGQGHGHLRARQVEVEVVGRRAALQARRAALWLPAPAGGVALATPPASRPASSDDRTWCRTAPHGGASVPGATAVSQGVA